MKHLQALLTTIICGALMQGLSSCTDVDLHEESLNSHRTGVTYKFNLTNIKENQPDTMCVIANRILGLWKSSMKVSTQDGKGIYLYNPQQMVFGTDSFAADTDTLTRFHLRSGEYKFLALTYGADELDYTGIDEFLENDEAEAADMYVTYRVYHREDPRLHLPASGWTDYNRYRGDTTYMQPSLKAICFQNVSRLRLADGSSTTVTFTPKRVTQHVTVSFEIKKDYGKNSSLPFVIDSVYAEISGIPLRMDLTTGYIDITNTAKTMFPMKFKKDVIGNKNVTCTATIDVPTIVRGTAAGMRGPGIMQVLIYTSEVDGSGKKVNADPELVTGRINLYQQLTDQKMYVSTADGRHYKKNGENKTIAVDATLIMDRTSIINDSTSQASSKWKNDGSGTVDISI